jgi:hypothetical protein
MTTMRAAATVLCALALAAALVAGYGYWRVNTRGAIYIHLRDIASQQPYGGIADARLFLLDADGRKLAEGRADPKYGTVMIGHPQAGYCGPDLPPQDYLKCHRVLSTWLMAWVHEVRYADLAFGSCEFRKIPLQFSVYRSGMLTWWVPLPHVGGDPYTMFNAALTVNGKTCTLPDRDQPR